ncbi:MAG: PA2778 family cysteine peptidase [Gammaproteobacteria bacterium]|nr:PA2778 family cysteine peptidase [Gammaproteobacteria bacterium]
MFNADAARRWLGGVLLSGITACTSLPVPRVDESSLSSHAELTAVGFFPQEDHQCGPAALATVLNASGVTVTPEELAAQVYLPARQCSLQVELLAATRRHARVPYVLEPQLDILLREIAAGHAVLVLQNLGFSWLPVWHYAVVVGFDLPQRELILRSGREPRATVGFGEFERSWGLARHWALLVTPLEHLPVTADETRYLSAIAELETQRQFVAAALAYTTALARWPGNPAARLGLGNSRYGLGQFAQAEEVYRELLAQQPTLGAAWNNLAMTLLELQRWDDALEAAQHAADLGGASEPAARDTLAEIRKRREKM